jgi:hypothetical protein
MTVRRVGQALTAAYRTVPKLRHPRFAHLKADDEAEIGSWHLMFLSPSILATSPGLRCATPAGTPGDPHRGGRGLATRMSDG